MSETNLNPKQLKAINLLVSGKTDTETAELVGVSRTTIYTWKNKDFDFKAELNRNMNEILKKARYKRISVLNKAYEVLEMALDKELEQEDPNPAAALNVIKNINIPLNAEEDPEKLKTLNNLFSI